MTARALALAGGAAAALCQWAIFAAAPRESSMGDVQRIFYLHFPLAFWSLLFFFLLFMGSIFYLVKKSPRASSFCQACAEIGALSCMLALFTGMVWAKKSWGVWWTWDPRLVTTLIMAFLYLSYLMIPAIGAPKGKAEAIRAALGIAGFLDVPLVFLSARLFRSIHPAVFASEGGGLPSDMKLIILICCLAMGLWAGALLLFRYRQLECARALDSLARRMPL